jgi:ATP-binding cassette subfamily F protein 3
LPGCYPARSLITHDRDFLDAVAGTIIHVDGQKPKTLHRQLFAVRADRRSSPQQASYEAAGQIAHLAFVDRFRAKAIKATGAEPDQGARTDGAHRRAHVDSPFEFSRDDTLSPRGNGAPRARDAGLRRRGDELPVLADLEWSTRPATASASSAATVPATDAAGRRSGTRPRAACHTAQNLKIGYFAQHQTPVAWRRIAIVHFGKIDPASRAGSA